MISQGVSAKSVDKLHEKGLLYADSDGKPVLIEEKAKTKSIEKNKDLDIER
jgi:hypothetical protein